MIETWSAKVTVRAGYSVLEHGDPLQPCNELSPSRLYGFTPREVGTLWTESLTSYINRLGWAHRVSPRRLLVQELFPHLSGPHHLWASSRLVGIFSRRGGAMGLNGTGHLAVEGATCLEQRTLRSDLHLLTLRWWVGDLPIRLNLRSVPAWCSACYAEWRERNLPIYHPLVWLFQVVTICPRHKRRLTERCPHCQKHQSVIAKDNMRPGACTQCATWLGTAPDAPVEQELEDELLEWQAWVIRALEELRVTSLFSGVLDWETFFTGLATGMQGERAYSKLARLTGIHRVVLHRWVHRTFMPSLENILQFCYVCGVTPLQVMKNQLAPLLQVIQNEAGLHPPQPRRAGEQRVNQAQCLELIQRVLDGREEILSMPQIARRLGCSQQTLTRQFPRESILITQRMKAFRQQQKEQRLLGACEEIRQAVGTLYAQGIFPSHQKVRGLLSNPHLIRMPEAAAAWHAARKELGIESESEKGAG